MGDSLRLDGRQDGCRINEMGSSLLGRISCRTNGRRVALRERPTQFGDGEMVRDSYDLG